MKIKVFYIKKRIKEILIIFIFTILILLTFEILARLYIKFVKGYSKIGISERNLYLKYQPYIMWGKDLDRLANDFYKKKSFKILIIGGSTAEGLKNEIIKKVFLESYLDIKEIDIINIASGGFNIRQEVISVVLVSEKIIPDLILVLDGANDITHSFRQGVKAGTPFIDQTYRIILEKPFFAPIVFILQNSQLYNGLLRFLARKNFSQKEAIVKVDKAVELYLQTRNFLNYYSKGRKIPIIFMLQPYVGFSNLPENQIAKNIYLFSDYVVKYGFEKITSAPSQDICFIDGNHEIKMKNLYLDFTDNVHFKGDIGYKYISSLFVTAYKNCYRN
jgi:hypothetical protein